MLPLANGKTLAVVGITTPETFTKSTPAYFQDENGEYIYGISGGKDGKALYADVQKAIDDATEAGADYVVGLGHLGIDPASSPWTSEEVVANTRGLTTIVDGHSHTKVEGKLVKDLDGKDVMLTQTKCYFEYIGEVKADNSPLNAKYDGFGVDYAEVTGSGRIAVYDEVNRPVEPEPEPEVPEVDPEEKPEVDPEDKPDVDPEEKPEVDPEDKPESPETGDTSVMLYAGLTVVAVAGAAVVLKKKEQF